MSVEARIQTSEIGVKYIELNETEYPHYHGMGDAVVYFDNKATITGIDYIHQTPEDGAKELFAKATKHGNAYIAMCSTYTVCELLKLENNLVGFNRIVRLLANAYDLEGV